MPNGLKLAYLSGVYDPKTHGLEDQPEPRVGYSRADVDVLVNFAERIVIGLNLYSTSLMLVEKACSKIHVVEGLSSIGFFMCQVHTLCLPVAVFSYMRLICRA